MYDLNTIVLEGRLTRDPEMVKAGDKTIAKFSLANQSGGKESQAAFFDCVAWEKTAETIKKYVGKGDKIFIQGRINQETWKDKTSGQNRSKVTVTANTIRLTAKPTGQKEPPMQSGPSKQAPGGTGTDEDIPF